MENLVTVAVPIYKRLEFLPRVLQVVAAQDYPDIELLVSDNGMNGSAVRDAVQRLYPRPCTFRQNQKSVEVVQHFNQMLRAAAGKYFVLLADDDEINPGFVSELMRQFVRHPRATLGFGRQEIVSESGSILAKSADVLPERMAGDEFILATWEKYSFGFQSVSTFVGKAQEMRESGCYPEFTRGTHIDDAMVVKLALRGDVVFSAKAVFRNLVQESSLGWSVSISQLAASVREFMRFVDTDPNTQRYARAHPARWQELRACLIRMSWGMYLSRWAGIYRKRLPYLAWARAAFALPFIPAYYRRAGRILLENLPALWGRGGVGGEGRG